MTPFTAYAPDLDPTTPGIITEMVNMVPTLRGYAGAPGEADVGMAALPAAALSVAVVTKLDGTNRLIAGTTTTLQEKSALTWTDVSRATPVYNATTTTPWRFAQFGNTTLAVNKQDVIQASTTGAFAAVDASAPKAGVICTSSGFVMVANTNDGVNDNNDRWWCSAYLDETDWTPAISTQCTTGRLVDSPGTITALKSLGVDVIAFKDRSMYIGRYAGPPSVWNWQLVPGEIGCSNQESCADIGTALVFIGPDDIYSFNGSMPVPVGSPIRKWFFADLDPGRRYLIRHSHDRKNGLVYFHYPRIGSSTLNGCIVYNYKSNKWGLMHRDVETTVDYITGGYTWDDLDAIIPTWADWPLITYDSPFWTASSRLPAYFNTSHKILSLTGASSTSSLTTGHYGEESQYSLLRRVTLRYLGRPTTATATNYHAKYLGGAWATGVATTEYNGRFDVLQAAPWHKIKFDFTGDCEITAAAADVKPAGVL